MDGIYIVRSNVKEMDNNSLVETYKSLSNVENAFRNLKTVDLKIRPIFHHLEDSVRAHIFLRMLTYYVLLRLKKKLAPVLFAEEDFESARKQKKSAAGNACKTQKTKEKVKTRINEEGFTVHSFTTLMRSLSTICQCTIQFGNTSINTKKITTPSKEQEYIFQLIGQKIQ